ncbi:RNA polymerase sigma factor [Amphibacillus sp. Q70]|uniref:RNA polymerase sigma factor n=1 Tax=Amphibacillus sp. Q70 TaxID=3453416 RepID=UPI003F835A92
MKKINKGNKHAFKKLYDSYADYALRTAYGITKNKHDAADIVQETFIKVFRNAGSFDMTRPFKPWFYQILVNEARRFIKKQSKQAIPVDTEETLDFFHQTKETKGDLILDLEALDPNDRTILILKYINGFKEKEIAEMLKLNINTVKSRLYKARRRLKSAMGGEDDEK